MTVVYFIDVSLYMIIYYNIYPINAFKRITYIILFILFTREIEIIFRDKIRIEIYFVILCFNVKKYVINRSENLK